MKVDSSISAIDAIARAQQVSANNVANLNTDGFKASSVVLESGPDGQGVRVGAIRQSSAPGAVIEGRVMSNTDIVTETVGQIVNRHGISANVAAIRAWEETTGHLLNMKV